MAKTYLSALSASQKTQPMRIFPTLCAVVGLWLSQGCAPASSEPAFESREEWVAWLQDAEKKMANPIELTIDTALALKYADQATAFADRYPQDSLAPEVLFRAADVLRGAGEFGKAIQLWGQVWRRYPQHRLAPDALFLQAFTFDNDLNAKEEARAYYEKVMAHYPDHPLAMQAAQLIQVLDKSLNELVRQFERRQPAH